MPCCLFKIVSPLEFVHHTTETNMKNLLCALLAVSTLLTSTSVTEAGHRRIRCRPQSRCFVPCPQPTCCVASCSQTPFCGTTSTPSSVTAGTTVAPFAAASCYKFKSTIQPNTYMCSVQREGHGQYWSYVGEYSNDPGCRACNQSISASADAKMIQPAAASCYKFRSTVQANTYMCSVQREGHGPNWAYVGEFKSDPGCRACNQSF